MPLETGSWGRIAQTLAVHPRGFLNRSYASLRTKRRPLAGPALQEVGKVNSLPARWKSLQDKALAGDESYMGVSNRGLQAPLARNLLHLAKFVPLAAAFNISARPGKRAEEPSPLGEIYPLATAFGNPTWLGKRAEKSSSPGKVCPLATAFEISVGVASTPQNSPPLGEIYRLATAFGNPT